MEQNISDKLFKKNLLCEVEKLIDEKISKYMTKRNNDKSNSVNTTQVKYFGMENFWGKKRYIEADENKDYAYKDYYINENEYEKYNNENCERIYIPFVSFMRLCNFAYLNNSDWFLACCGAYDILSEETKEFVNDLMNTKKINILYNKWRIIDKKLCHKIEYELFKVSQSELTYGVHDLSLLGDYSFDNENTFTEFGMSSSVDIENAFKTNEVLKYHYVRSFYKRDIYSVRQTVTQGSLNYPKVSTSYLSSIRPKKIAELSIICNPSDKSGGDIVVSLINSEHDTSKDFVWTFSVENKNIPSVTKEQIDSIVSNYNVVVAYRVVKCLGLCYYEDDEYCDMFRELDESFNHLV